MNTYFSKSTGEMVAIGVLPDEAYLDGDTICVEGVYLEHCYDGTKPVPKQDYTLDSLPLPCTVTIEGVEYEVTEQPTFEFDVPGTYTIQVDAGPRFLQKEFTIDYQA